MAPSQPPRPPPKDVRSARASPKPHPQRRNPATVHHHHESFYQSHSAPATGSTPASAALPDNEDYSVKETSLVPKPLASSQRPYTSFRPPALNLASSTSATYSPVRSDEAFSKDDLDIDDDLDRSVSNLPSGLAPRQTNRQAIEAAPRASSSLSRSRSILSTLSGVLRSPKPWQATFGIHRHTVSEEDDLDSLIPKDRPTIIASSSGDNPQHVVVGDDHEDGATSIPLKYLSGSKRRALQSLSLEQEHVEESKGNLTGGLGSGMDEVVSSKLPSAIPASLGTALMAPLPTHAAHRGLRRSVRVANRGTDLHFDEVHVEEAAKRNEIVAVPEPADMAVDLSNAEGTNPLYRANAGSGDDDEEADGANAGPKQSYYFPPDPQMPNWRPFPMRPWYIITLITLALFLAAIQEYLCQKSLSLARDGQGGLINFTRAQEVSALDFFAFKYLPTIVLVTYGVMWQTVDFDIKQLEPFYQLSRPTGATAAQSLNMDYLSFFSYLVPFKAIHYRQWAVTLASLGTLLASAIVPILQSAALNIYPPRSQRLSADTPKYVRVDPVWSRLMEAMLLVVALAGVALLFQLRRKSGLLSNPQGIAGIAAMATRSHILNDFRGLDTADHNQIHKQLKHRRYILHKSSLWQGAYTRSTTDKSSDSRMTKNPHPVMLQLNAGIAYIAFIMVVFLLVPVFMFTRANVVTEKAPWLLTALVTIIKMLWSTLECNIRMIEPFYQLSKRHAPSWILTLDYRGTVPGWMPIKALLNRHYLTFLVGAGAVLTEVLTVCVSSFNVDGKAFVPVNSITHSQHRRDDEPGESDTTETFHSFWGSFSLALAILSALALIAGLVYARRRHSFLPRQPSTIASVLAFIAQSKMLYDFVTDLDDDVLGKKRIEEMDSDAMTKHLGSLGKTYGLGWIRGRDGELHVGIDEEELVTDYTHGKDYRASHLNLNEIGRWEHL